MEKFFIITNSSELHRDYFNHKENKVLVNDHIKTFLEANGIEARDYYVNNHEIHIVPTEKDLEAFKGVLCEALSNGLMKFKTNSKIGKSWVKSLQEIGLKVKDEPRVIFYVRTGGGRFRSRLFEQSGVLYCSIEPFSEDTPKGFVEIKASEFFKVIEEAEAVSA